MKVNEVKETREVVVKTEYIADDGRVFETKEECEKYEKTCECVIMADYKSLVKGYVSEARLFNTGCEDYGYDLVEIKNEVDREIVNKALKFYNEYSNLVESEAIGKTIMISKDYDNSLNGWYTTIDRIIASIKREYEKVLGETEGKYNENSYVL